jgi:carbon monoxide dehydrogenase subunit G
MKLLGSHTFPVSPETLWPLLTDPNTITAVMPGCQTLESVSEYQYQGELTIPLGPMAGSYSGNLSLSHIVENEGYAFTFTAQSQTGTIGGNGRLHLQPQNNHTILTYEGEAKVGGQLADHAMPLLETTARSLTRQSLENLDYIIQHGTTPIPVPQPINLPPSDKPISNQQTTVLVIATFTVITLFILFYFFNRKSNENS